MHSFLWWRTFNQPFEKKSHAACNYARLQAQTRASDISIPLPLANGLWIHSCLWSQVATNIQLWILSWLLSKLPSRPKPNPNTWLFKAWLMPAYYNFCLTAFWFSSISVSKSFWKPRTSSHSSFTHPLLVYSYISRTILDCSQTHLSIYYGQSIPLLNTQ